MTLVLSPLFLSHFFSCLLFLGLLAAAVLGYDAFGIIKYIKNPKQQGATATVSKYQHQHSSIITIKLYAVYLSVFSK